MWIFFTNSPCYWFCRKIYTCTPMRFDWAKNLAATYLLMTPLAATFQTNLTSCTWHGWVFRTFIVCFMVVCSWSWKAGRLVSSSTLTNATRPRLNAKDPERALGVLMATSAAEVGWYLIPVHKPEEDFDRQVRVSTVPEAATTCIHFRLSPQYQDEIDHESVRERTIHTQLTQGRKNKWTRWADRERFFFFSYPLSLYTTVLAIASNPQLKMKANL